MELLASNSSWKWCPLLWSLTYMRIPFDVWLAKSGPSLECLPQELQNVSYNLSGINLLYLIQCD